MAQVGIGMPAPDLGTAHQQAAIILLNDIPGLQRPGEAGPARTGIELVEGAEERLPGDDIDVDAFPLVLFVLIPERRLGAAFLGDLVLEGSQLFPERPVVGLPVTGE